MKKRLIKFWYYLERVYRLALPYKKIETVLWKDLLKLFKASDWYYGVYQQELRIEANFEIAAQKGGTFHYMLYDDDFHCRVKVLVDFDTDITTDLFVLASHFNNLLRNGVVVVDVNNNFVEYHTKADYTTVLLYPDEKYRYIMQHFGTSKDIYWAFQKLVREREEPSIIIADLLRINDEKKQRSSNE